MTVSELLDKLKEADPKSTVVVGTRKGCVDWIPTDLTIDDNNKEFIIYCNDYKDIEDE